MNRSLMQRAWGLGLFVGLVGGAASAAEQVIDLSSKGGFARYRLPADTQEVELVKQHSGGCRLGRSWGYDLGGRDLWVDGGCSASFKIITREAPSADAPSSSNTAVALAAAAAIAGVAILASRGRDHDDESQPYYPPDNGPGYRPPNSGYYPPPPGSYPQGGGRRGAIRGLGGMCLDMEGGVRAGTKAIVYRCNGGTNQRFNWRPSGELVVGGLCLDVAGGSSNNGAAVQAWQCNGGRNQQWYADGSKIRSRSSGKCLDVVGSNRREGTPVVIHDCHGGENQRWFW